jgi:ADP-ribose pyrophosphatase YjhB (NUDIX family)
MNEEISIIKRWVGGVCIKNDQVLLVHRINNDVDFNKEYFVFPGKEVEGDESIESALKSAFEDFSITVELEDLLYSKEDELDDQEFFYLCKHLLGEPHVQAESNEAHEMEESDQVYAPLWVNISDIDDLIIYPESVKALILEDRE